MPMIPTVHMNGDSKADLLSSSMEAHNAVRKAIEAIAGTFPNGRNFYPQGDGAILQAMREHRDRINALELVRQELEQIVEGVSEQ